MNKVLIIIAHPNSEGHNRYFLKKIQEKLDSNNILYNILDLYEMNFDPCLKQTELYTINNRHISDKNIEIQNMIKESDRLLFIFPTWWQNMPAILKGFFDRIFTPKFAYQYSSLGIPEGLLKNKKAAIFTTTGGPSVYEKYIISLPSVKLIKNHILKFSGIKSKGFALYSAKNLEKNKNRIEKISLDIYKYLIN